jgi:HAD superfamily hydrolase (TIGR01549 family)
MTQAVVFDVDGTLVDSVDLHAESWRVALEKFGKRPSFEEVRRQIGKGADQLMPVFLSKEELARFGAELDEFRGRLFKREYLPRVKGFPKVPELFQRLKRDNKRVALASSAKGDELDAYKRIAGIDDLVEAETSSDDADRSKPYPDIFQAALARLPGIAVDEIVVIGDTPYDAQAASKAKLHTIGLLCGGWSEDELRKAGCIAVYRDAADLLEHYDRSPLSGPGSVVVVH